MTKNPHVTIHRKDYTAPAYWVNTVEMGFDLDPAATRVATRITLQRNSASPNRDVELLGDGVKLVALRMNGKTLRKGVPNKNNPDKNSRSGYTSPSYGRSPIDIAKRMRLRPHVILKYA